MAITTDQQTEILQVVVGLFGAAPGSTYMTELANLYESNGSNTQQLAESLDDTPVFRDQILAGKVTTEQQVKVLMSHFGLEADDDSSDDDSSDDDSSDDDSSDDDSSDDDSSDDDSSDDTASAGSQAQAYFTEKLGAGESFGKIVFDAVTYLNGTPAPEFADTKALLDNQVRVARIYSEDHASTDVNELQKVIAGVSSTFPATDSEVDEYLESIGQGNNPGASEQLKFGADTFNGGAGNDTYNAGLVSDGGTGLINSLDDVDNINGGGGRDTLNATLNNVPADTIAPEISNVEIINVRNVTAPVTLGLNNVTGAEQIWNNATADGLTLTFDDAPIEATYGVRNTESTTDINFDDVEGDEDNLALAVTGAGEEGTGEDDDTPAVITSDDADNIETISIAATGENLIDVSDFTAITDLTVTGAGLVDAEVDATELETVDASGNTGGVTLDLSTAANDLSITGGSGNDDITSGTGEDTIDLGAGDDRAEFASGELTEDDTVTGGDGEDTLALDGSVLEDLDTDLLTGFEALELLAGADGEVNIDNEDFGLTKIALGEDLGQDLTIENLGDSTLEVKSSQSGNITVDAADTAGALNLVINAEGENDDPITLGADGVDDGGDGGAGDGGVDDGGAGDGGVDDGGAGDGGVDDGGAGDGDGGDDVVAQALVATDALVVTGAETINLSTTAETDDIIITSFSVGDVGGMTFAGEGDVIIGTLNGDEEGTGISNIDLTGQTGGFELTNNNLGYGTTFTLGNLGETDTATHDFDDDGEGDSASELDASAGDRDIFQFTTEFDGNVAIDGAEVGGNIRDDRIDLSTFGLSGIDDLTLTDVTEGVVISGEEQEGQILLVGITADELTESDFIF